VHSYSLTHLSDSALDRALESAARDDSRATAWLLAHLAESDARRRHAPAGYPSMFEYCVGHLRFSEDAAYKRIRVARAARMFPAIYRLVAEGKLHLTGALMLAPHLTTVNAGELLEAATSRTKSEIEHLLAARFPRPDVTERIVALAPSGSAVQELHTQLAPERVGMTAPEQELGPASEPLAQPGHPGAVPHVPALAELSARTVEAPAPRPRVTPLAPERFAIQCTVSKRTCEKLRRAQDLLRHRIPGGELDQVLDCALDALIEKLEKRKLAATDRPRAAKPGTGTRSRAIPAAVKRAVWKRDRGQCTFRSETGRRCEARGHLEFDHELPAARGGRSTAGNLRLRCRAHNQYEAEQAYGGEFMRQKRAAARRVTEDRRRVAAAMAQKPRGATHPASREPVAAASGHQLTSALLPTTGEVPCQR